MTHKVEYIKISTHVHVPWRRWRSQALLTVRSWELLSDWALASNTKLFGVGCMLQLVLYAHLSSFIKYIFLNLLKCLSRGAAVGYQIPFTALCWKPHLPLFSGWFLVVFVWTNSRWPLQQSARPPDCKISRQKHCPLLFLGHIGASQRKHAEMLDVKGWRGWPSRFFGKGHDKTWTRQALEVCGRSQLAKFQLLRCILLRGSRRRKFV